MRFLVAGHGGGTIVTVGTRPDHDLRRRGVGGHGEGVDDRLCDGFWLDELRAVVGTALGGHDLLLHGRVDAPGVDACHAEGGLLLAQRVAPGLGGELGGAVRAPARFGGKARAGVDVDDVAAGGAQGGQELVSQERGLGDVDVEGAVPFVAGGVLEVVEVAHAGEVDGGIQGFVKTSEPVRIVEPRHARHVRRLLPVPLGVDLVAFLNEQREQCPAYSPGCACDECFHAVPLSVLPYRSRPRKPRTATARKPRPIRISPPG